MSTSPEVSKRRLTIYTGLPTAEIFVLDGMGVPVARSAGSLSAELACGFYKVRYLAGSEVTDEILELPPGAGDLVHHAPQLKVDVVARREPSASSLSLPNNPSGAPGARGELSVTFTFDSTSPPPLAMGLKIRGFDGKELGTLSEESMKSGQGWITLSLEGGCYLLETQNQSAGATETIEQCVYVASGWRTEVLVPAGRGEPDVGNAAVFMAQPQPGDITERDFNLAEMARQALASSRGPDAELGKSAAQAMIDALLHGKFANPMLGIYGAHLMLRGRYSDKKLLAEVADNLKRLVGDHPDAKVLRLELEDADAGAIQFRTPPMLRSSWQIIVRHGSRAGLVPTDSYTAGIAGNLRGWGAWLQWKSPEVEDHLEAAALEKPDFKKLAEWASTLGADHAPANLPPLEQALFRYLALSGAPREFARKLTSAIDKRLPLGKFWSPAWRYVVSSDIEDATQGAVEKALAPKAIATSLGIPETIVTAAAGSLWKRFSAEAPGWRSFSRLFDRE